MHLDVLQSPDRPVPMTPTVARCCGSPSGFAKVAEKKGWRLELESEGENEGAGKPESKFGGRAGTVKSLEWGSLVPCFAPSSDEIAAPTERSAVPIGSNDIKSCTES